MDRFMVLPIWLRNFVPWKMLSWIDERTNICWSQVVIWKMLGTDGDLRVSSLCFDSSPEKYDYCAKFCVKTWCETGKLKRVPPPATNLDND